MLSKLLRAMVGVSTSAEPKREEHARWPVYCASCGRGYTKGDMLTKHELEELRLGRCWDASCTGREA
jgi:hypothetical protein